MKEKVGKLQVLLASLSVFRQNLYGFHWNGQGCKFYPYHEKFQELYEDLGVRIDEVAELIRTCGYKAVFSMTDYSLISAINEVPIEDTCDIDLGILHAGASLKRLIVCVRESSEDFAAEGKNEVVNLMDDYLTSLNKLRWLWESSRKVEKEADEKAED